MLFSSPFFCFDDPTSILSPRGLVRLLFSLLISVCQDHILSFANPFSTRVLCFQSSIFSSYQVLIQLLFLFNRSVARSCSSLFLFSNGVFSTSFISVVFFSRNGLTFSRFFGFTHWSKKQLSFTSSLSLPFFPPVPF